MDWNGVEFLFERYGPVWERENNILALGFFYRMVSAQIENQGIFEAAVQGGVGSWNILQFLNPIQVPC